MTFRRLVLACSLLTLLTSATIAQQAPESVKASDLKNHPFQVGGLELGIAKLDDNVVTSADVRDCGVGYLDLRITNVMGDFVRFVPSQFVVVGRDGRQASPGYERRWSDRVPPAEISVAPRATTQMRYNLTARIRFPADVYYDGTLLARVTN